MAERLRVQVCYTRPDSVFLRELDLPAGSTLQQAVLASGLLEQFPEIDLAAAKLGVHGKLRTLDAALREGDRIEVYRPLQADPKDARRRRAVKQGRVRSAG